MTIAPGTPVRFDRRAKRVILGVGDRGPAVGWHGVVERLVAVEHRRSKGDRDCAVVAHEPEDCSCHLEPQARLEQPIADCPRCAGTGVARRRTVPLRALVVIEPSVRPRIEVGAIVECRTRRKDGSHERGRIVEISGMQAAIAVIDPRPGKPERRRVPIGCKVGAGLGGVGTYRVIQQADGTPVVYPGGAR